MEKEKKKKNIFRYYKKLLDVVTKNALTGLAQGA